MQGLLRDCVPEPQVTLHGLHGGLLGGRSPIVRSIIIIIIIIIIIRRRRRRRITEILIIRIDASS